MRKASTRSSRLSQVAQHNELITESMNDESGEPLLAIDTANATCRVVRYKPSPNPHAPIFFELSDKDDGVKPTATRQLHLDSESEHELDGKSRRPRRNRLVPPSLTPIKEQEPREDNEVTQEAQPTIASDAPSQDTVSEEQDAERTRRTTRRLCVSRLTPSKRASARKSTKPASKDVDASMNEQFTTAALPFSLADNLQSRADNLQSPLDVIDVVAVSVDIGSAAARGDASPLAIRASSEPDEMGAPLPGISLPTPSSPGIRIPMPKEEIAVENAPVRTDEPTPMPQLRTSPRRPRVHNATPMKQKTRSVAVVDNDDDIDMGDVPVQAKQSRKHSSTPMKRQARSVAVLSDDSIEDLAALTKPTATMDNTAAQAMSIADKDEPVLAKRSSRNRAPTPAALRRSSRAAAASISSQDDEHESDRAASEGVESVAAVSSKGRDMFAEDGEGEAEGDFESIRHTLSLDDADAEAGDERSQSRADGASSAKAASAVSALDEELQDAVNQLTPLKKEHTPRKHKDTRSRLSFGTPSQALHGDEDAVTAAPTDSPRRSRRLSSIGLPSMTPHTLERSRSFDAADDIAATALSGDADAHRNSAELGAKADIASKEESGGRVHKSTPRYVSMFHNFDCFFCVLSFDLIRVSFTPLQENPLFEGYSSGISYSGFTSCGTRQPR